MKVPPGATLFNDNLHKKNNNYKVLPFNMRSILSVVPLNSMASQILDAVTRAMVARISKLRPSALVLFLILVAVALTVQATGKLY